MARWYDDAMVRSRWCDSSMVMLRRRDCAMPWWRCCDNAKVIVQLQRIYALSRHRYRSIALLTFLHIRCYKKKWYQMWIFIMHNKVNIWILDRCFIYETFIFLVYCCKFIKNVLNAFIFFCIDINLKIVVLWMRWLIPWRGIFHKLQSVYMSIILFLLNLS